MAKILLRTVSLAVVCVCPARFVASRTKFPLWLRSQLLNCSWCCLPKVVMLNLSELLISSSFKNHFTFDALAPLTATVKTGFSPSYTFWFANLLTTGFLHPVKGNKCYLIWYCYLWDWRHCGVYEVIISSISKTFLSFAVDVLYSQIAVPKYSSNLLVVISWLNWRVSSSRNKFRLSDGTRKIGLDSSTIQTMGFCNIIN